MKRESEVEVKPAGMCFQNKGSFQSGSGSSSKTLPLTKLQRETELLVKQKRTNNGLLKKVSVSMNHFCHVVRHSKLGSQPVKVKQAFLVGGALAVEVVPKDYVAAAG